MSSKSFPSFLCEVVDIFKGTMRPLTRKTTQRKLKTLAKQGRLAIVVDNGPNFKPLKYRFPEKIGAINVKP